MQALTGRAAHLELSIDVGSDPIRGSVAVEAGVPQPFCGWMELTAAIEAARAPRAPLARSARAGEALRLARRRAEKT